MGRVVTLALAVLRRPSGWLSVSAVAGLGSLLLLLPLFGQPGLELALGVSALLTVGGMALGATAAAEARKPPRARIPRLAPSGPLGAVGAAIGAAFLLGAAAAAIPFLGAVTLTGLSTPCSPWAQSVLYPVLVLPTALLAAATGVFARTLFPSRLGTAAVCLALFLASLAWTGWPIAVGPQVFAYNFFLGWFPGPLYDEALHVSGALLWFRLESLLWATLLGLAAAMLFQPAGHASAPGRGRVLPGLGATLLAILGLELHAVDFGFRASDARVQQVLGGRGETTHAELFFPAEKPEEQVDRLRRDVEFRWQQVAEFLGGAPSAKVRVYVFRSAEEKEQLVGASGTQFTKGLSVYLNDAPFPNPVLQHELVHALASRFGKGPFGVTVRFGVIPVMGVVEGVAEAPQQTRSDLTLHEWAAGMRREKLMPDIRELLRPEGFYLSAPDRAYTAAGSFIRWLRDSYGAAKLQALLAHADFQAVYGQSLGALATQWEQMLDSLQLDDRTVNRAFSRFRQGSVFARPCAREVAGLALEASQANPLRALELVRRCVALQPEEPSFALQEAAALQRLGRLSEASQVLLRLQSRVEGLPALEVETGLARVRLAFLSGEWDDAPALLEQLANAKPGLNLERQVAVWRAAETAGDAGRSVMAYLVRPDELRELGLQRALATAPEQPLVHYLLGRRLLDLGAPAAAGAHLRTALALGLPPPVDREAWRLRVSADYLAGDCGAVADDAGQLPAFGPGLRAEVTEWQARCAFDVKTFKGPLVPADPFR
ncbi:MAG: tetratricopeptide repeat protein [Myxococcaceae bacterium]